MLGFLEKLTLTPGEVEPEDARRVLAAGVSGRGMAEAIRVASLFNLIDRVADALGFEALPDELNERGAQWIIDRGYERGLSAT